MAQALYITDSNDKAMPYYSELRDIQDTSHTVNLPDGSIAIVDETNWVATANYAGLGLSVSLGRDLNKDEKLTLANQMRDAALGFVPPDPIAEANKAAASVTYNSEFEKVQNWTSENISKPIGKGFGAIGETAGAAAGSALSGFFSTIGVSGLVLVAIVAILLYTQSGHVQLRTHKIL